MNDSHADTSVVGHAADNPFADVWPSLPQQRARRIVRILAAAHGVGALLTSQSFSLALWTAWGGKRTFRRMALTVVGMVAVMHVGWHFCYLHDYRNFLVFFMPLTAAACAVFLVLRLLGLELKLPTEPEAPRRVFQFSLIQLMGLTLTLAVCLSALQYLPKDNYLFDLKTLFLTGSCILVGMVSVGLVFFRRWLLLRVFAFPATLILATALIRWKYYAYIPFFDAQFFFTVLSIGTMISLAIVRWAGYRMTWHRRFRLVK
jgi:hypothetical protein